MEKVILYALIAYIACCVTACHEENNLLNSNDKSDEIITSVLVEDNNIYPYTQGIALINNMALKFPNEESLNDFKEKLSKKRYTEKLQIVSDYGVKSLHIIAMEADNELEEIGNIANSETEFRNLYKIYKEKYNNILIVNKENENDLSLYVPDENNIESFICNKYGIYVVGNEIRYAKLNNSLPIQALPPAVTNDKGLLKKETNNIQTNKYDVYPKDGKRVHFEISRKYNTIHINMYAKKKMWYGWKDDNHRDYIFDLNVQASTTIEWKTQFYSRYHSVTKVDDDMFLLKGNGTVTGKVYTWTDMTAELDSNGDLIIIPIGNTYAPKCLESKAVIVNVSL